MNDFLYHELIAEEYRRDQIAQAEKYNKHPLVAERSLMLRAYRILSKLGGKLEAHGAKMQARYNYLATREECKPLPSN